MPGKTIVAIVCVTALLAIAISRSIDGTLLTFGIAIIAGLGGYAAHKIKKS